MAVQLMHSYVSVATDDPCVAFTFDDGPHLTRTPLVLDLLAERNARATFFVVGEHVRDRPDAARRLVDEGHEVGVHGDVHVSLEEWNLPTQLRAIGRARRAVRRATGQSPAWFRPPYGKQNKRTVIATRLLGMKPVMWTSHAAEWTDQSLDDCVAMAAPGVRPGGVVLLHDGTGSGTNPPGRDDDALVDFVASMLDVADERGLRVVSFGDLAERGPAVRRPWFGEWNV